MKTVTRDSLEYVPSLTGDGISLSAFTGSGKNSSVTLIPGLRDPLSILHRPQLRINSIVHLKDIGLRSLTDLDIFNYR